MMARRASAAGFKAPAPAPPQPKMKVPEPTPQPRGPVVQTAQPPILVGDTNLAEVRTRNLQKSRLVVTDPRRPADLGSSLGVFTAPVVPPGSAPDTAQMQREGEFALESRDFASDATTEAKDKLTAVRGMLAVKGAPVAAAVVASGWMPGLPKPDEIPELMRQHTKLSGVTRAGQQQASVQDALAQVLRQRLEDMNPQTE